VHGLLAVLAALECEIAGLPDWVLSRDDDTPSSAIVESSALTPRHGHPPH
jgi:hypothetical protein